MRPRVGSLCSGYGGLDLAVEDVFDAETVWHAELDPAASKILAHRWPGVPNLGDIKLTHWGRVPKVDILTAGYPCQPFSSAGRRNGTADPRHLWPFVAQAVRRVRPRYVVLENVAGHRSLGFGRVLGDLAAMRYVGAWVSLRASDVGACHGRDRVFILAADADHATSDGQWPRPELGQGSPAPTDAADLGHERAGAARDGWDGSADCGVAATDAAGAERGDAESDDLEAPAGSAAELGERPGPDWRQYGPAVRRWGAVLGRVAPQPAESVGTRSVLSPRFVEWMQGLPAGWVTDLDLTRSEQLHALGNGVIRQQAAEALRWLLLSLERVA